MEGEVQQGPSVGRRAGAALGAAVLLGAAACGADPSAVYRDSAVKALEGSLSEARTAELAGFTPELDDDLARLAAKEQDGTLSPAERRILDNAGQARDSLANADAYTDPLDPDLRPGGTLWLYDPAAYDGDGRVAVAVGDLDHASDVAIFTPGITTDMNLTLIVLGKPYFS